MSSLSRSVNRYLGCLIGLAAGDALGTTVEFCSRDTFSPLTTIVGGGPFNLKPGEWTDDTSMALCLGHSLIFRNGFDPVDQMNRYCNWANYGYMSSNGECFDIGGTVAVALKRYQQTGEPFSGSVDPGSAGNGAVMRLAPVPMFFGNSLEKTIHFSGESARTTHGAMEVIECARLFGAQIRAALCGSEKRTIIENAGYSPGAPKLAEIASGGYRRKSDREIKGTGYIVDSLEAALWCFERSDSYETAVLMAANLGDDADTTAAICGQLAGAHYGVEAIPQHWKDCLAMYDEIEALALRLFQNREAG